MGDRKAAKEKEERIPADEAGESRDKKGEGKVVDDPKAKAGAEEEEAEENGADESDTRRTRLVQVKVSAGLRNKAIRRAKDLDMGLSEYIRFLLYCDIHGFTVRNEPSNNGGDS
jgi:hypothetical protein